MTPPFSPPDPVVPAAPLTPPLVSVASEGPPQPRASWVHTPWGRDGYRGTLYQAGVPVGSSPVGAQVDGASLSALTPGTEYEVQVVAQAGPLHVATAGASGWACEWHWNGQGRSSGRAAPGPLLPPSVALLPPSRPSHLHPEGPAWGHRRPALLPTAPLVPTKLLVSMQAGSAVVSLAWASGRLGHGVCRTHLDSTSPCPCSARRGRSSPPRTWCCCPWVRRCLSGGAEHPERCPSCPSPARLGVCRAHPPSGCPSLSRWASGPEETYFSLWPLPLSRDRNAWSLCASDFDHLWGCADSHATWNP